MRDIRPVILNAKDIASLRTEDFSETGHNNAGSVSWKTLLSDTNTASNTFAAGIAKCVPQGGHLKCHRHTQAEMYFIIRGQGKVVIDGEQHSVEQGSLVFIPGDAEHGMVNDGQEDLEWLYVFATDRFSDVVYRFSADDKKIKAKL